ncbi:hypothetical protein LOTGIDRAFT_162267 [Lottia gigantea]|uniref:EF-hand domain-containing protein n=1 Tax=Lottia gigantea TaxID=225164 RepID=V4ACF0_LOTGI|nr:hypothetical protein LOTGIDRAFT_162267 [Lottia gigantea]ESO92785.1 hypothetical protein LOTGIDRAFT_162267 [Lottia gigantea]
MFHTNNLKPYNDTAYGMFHANDFNRDGIFERVEINFTFQIYDSNPEDGRVSHAEYTTYINYTTPNLYPLSSELYKIYDVDNDNLLEIHDYDNFFNLMDSDEDQQVTEHEFVRYWTIVSCSNLHFSKRSSKILHSWCAFLSLIRTDSNVNLKVLSYIIYD